MLTNKVALIALVLLAIFAGRLSAGELTVTIEPADRVARVGVVRRFNFDGTLARKVDPKAKFESPYYDGSADGHEARFRDLQPGVYDVIVFLKDGTRLEGYHWPLFNEFDDPNDPAFKTPPPEEVEELIREKIAGTTYHENKVTPLAAAGSDKQVRILMQLLRDRATSYDGEFGAPVATLRYEIWQYTNNYGGWTRDRHSKVLHRILDAKSNVRKHTWLWDPKLGGMRVSRTDTGKRLSYQIPRNLKPLPGLHPY